MNEQDALANIDFNTAKKRISSANWFSTIGTFGGLQPNSPVGTFVCSQKSIGFDGLLSSCRTKCCIDLPLNGIPQSHGLVGKYGAPAPYVIDASEELIDRIAKMTCTWSNNRCEVSLSGRDVTTLPWRPETNDKIESSKYKGYKIATSKWKVRLWQD
jgi:uridine phosphorylase